ncbi:unnamed protein product [Rotaria sp. Silwood2]|nr:unnamed protein product [Rotaria sp. Silwood2]CAF3376383.1 unnamed protein product [Rotaria sp. Silwood2]CAF3386250.1 unnamed protein product [Rotaria sp. Silwood2]CAF4275860.1 unnamed protein product [Rotaria sp. Silwood2]CAF4313550.1 unnamed protein product [Rotaria sp. Silwood2]
MSENRNKLPDDIFSYNQDKFYEFIKYWYGNDLADLFTFQAIRNASHLMHCTADQVLSILEHDSDDIDQLKNLCGFRLANNQFQIKLGVKLAINSLIELLKIKQEQEKKKKRPLNYRPPSNIDTSTNINQTQSQNQAISPSAIPLSPSSSDTCLTTLTSTSIKNMTNEVDHILDIKNRINNWYIKGDNDNVLLDEGTHYSLEINKSINNTYACVLTCQCNIRFKLPFLAAGYFKLSSFYRHLKEKDCIKLSNMTTTTNDKSINKENQPNSSSKSSNTMLKKTSITSKRLRSPSRETPSNSSKTNAKKKSIDFNK